MPVYFTVKSSPMYKQMSTEELLFDDYVSSHLITQNISNTRTYKLENVNRKLQKICNVEELTSKLEKFNNNYREIGSLPRESLYHTFFIPKHSGGLRRIDAPNAELMDALRSLKTIFEEDFHVLYHTSAFAYIKKRSTIDAVKRHQQNESNWYGKFDLSNFFGSTSLEFVMKMFSMIFPFSEVVKTKRGKVALEQSLDLAFLNGGLPQGTPISPLITNVMMIPIDYKLSNTLKSFSGQQDTEEQSHQRLIYTRYADDFLISSKYEFNIKAVEKFIVDTLAEFNAPFTLNSAKTRYGSRAGRNWNLGIMVNKDNNLTVGHKKKKQFQAMLSSYIMDKLNGKEWCKNDVQVMEGYRNYYRMIEGTVIDNIVSHIANKFNVETVERSNGINLKFILDDLGA